MNELNGAALDRHITGNYGVDDDRYNGERDEPCCVKYDVGACDGEDCDGCDRQQEPYSEADDADLSNDCARDA